MAAVGDGAGGGSAVSRVLEQVARPLLDGYSVEILFIPDKHRFVAYMKTADETVVQHGYGESPRRALKDLLRRWEAGPQ
jgi:hypothetical protein